jgi:hypothetical protein
LRLLGDRTLATGALTASFCAGQLEVRTYDYPLGQTYFSPRPAEPCRHACSPPFSERRVELGLVVCIVGTQGPLSESLRPFCGRECLCCWKGFGSSGSHKKLKEIESPRWVGGKRHVLLPLSSSATGFSLQTFLYSFLTPHQHTPGVCSLSSLLAPKAGREERDGIPPLTC